jgi:DNA mismatch endonuclease, patch repair protein
VVDVLSAEQRRLNMSRIRGRDTKPEIAVRRIAHRLGYRFRLHRRDLPGRPDLVFPRLTSVIHVHGCYWHMHSCAFGRVVPKTNASFWQTKRLSNVARDRVNSRLLRRLGWRSLTVWECELRDVKRVERRIKRFLSS